MTDLHVPRSLPAAHRSAGQASAAVLATALLLHLLGGETSQALHLAVFRAINATGAWAPELWSGLSVLGLGLSALIVFALAAPPASNRASQAGTRLLAALLACFPIGGALTHGIKNLVQMARPAAALGLDQLVVVGTPLLSKSMPSGHAVTAFTVATLISLDRRLPRPWRLAVWTLCVAVAISRIAVGAHWPADVCAGGALGVLVGHAGWWCAQRGRWVAHLMSPIGSAVLALGLLACSVVMWGLPTGYPLALPGQRVLGAIGAGVALWRLAGLWRVQRGRRGRAQPEAS
ncbi:phosphatase PAP2 family protein [Leptothrix discophora]|uniref:Phosphatase PAP2 family protein n=1 Tax=Leptothrix discophora TaxID=89 RepID=A0ABT9G7F1_LEPDI|nr:phosphatase PAP2 family protein [Leptothrix discophora]MDP4302103.1 phosphatase PAP2 family protein [Leptothrix discophora]